MYVVFDASAIAAAIEANAPRSVEAVLLEMYPDAVIDRRGRAHAPCDGYETEDGLIYRGGEYLPEPEGIDEMRGASSSRYKPCIRLFDVKQGAEVYLEGTKAQIQAGREIAKQQQAEIDCSKSHVGTVGKRETFEAKIYTIFDNTTQYGVQFTHYMRDEAMNPIVYRGTKKLAKEGDTVCFDATVKSHWTGANGRVATYVNRPKIR